MAGSSALSVIVYENVSRLAPFYYTSAFSGAWALCVVVYFTVRLRAHLYGLARLGRSFGEAEAAMLRARRQRAEKRETTTTTTMGETHGETAPGRPATASSVRLQVSYQSTL